MENFGTRLKRMRELRKWSVAELSAKADVLVETIYRAEKGTHLEPKLSVATRLARALGVSLDLLVDISSDEHVLPRKRKSRKKEKNGHEKFF